jgi:pyrroline-5-carboxylate reductase
MARAAVSRKVVAPVDLAIVNRTPAKAEALAETLGAHHCTAQALSEWHPQCVILAVKPKDVSEGAQIARAALRDGGLVLSVLAGVTTARLRELLGPRIGIVRAMPNVASLYGAGVTAWCSGGDLHESHKSWCVRLFESLGSAFEVADDTAIDIATAVFASSPAFLLYVVEQLESRCDGLGLTAEEGRRLLAQLLRGCAALVESSRPLHETRASVVSPGGTTAAGLAVLAGGHVGTIFRDAVSRSIQRAGELSKLY